MPTCSVSGCTRTKRNKVDPDHKFFTFPKTSPLVEKWIKFCRKDSLTKEQVLTRAPKICSIHFKEDYIEIPLKYRLLPQFTPKNMRMLRKDAVPTIRNPKKKNEEEEDEKKQMQKKLEYSRIVAELLEQSEKDAAAEKEKQESEGVLTIETNGEGESISAGKKTKASKNDKQKSPMKIKTNPSPNTKSGSSETKKRSKKIQPSIENKKSVKRKGGDQKKKVSFADSDSNDETYEPDVDSDNQNTDNENGTTGSDKQVEDTSGELLRLQRENKKLTDLTIKQSLQIADLIKQRNDLWREKGDLWFRKRMEQQPPPQPQLAQQQPHLTQHLPLTMHDQQLPLTLQDQQQPMTLQDQQQPLTLQEQQQPMSQQDQQLQQLQPLPPQQQLQQLLQSGIVLTKPVTILENNYLHQQPVHSNQSF